MIPLVTVWRWMGRHRRRYAASILALIASSLCLYLAPWIARLVIDEVLQPNPEAESWAITLLGGRKAVAEHLEWPALLMVVVAIAGGGFAYLQARWSATATEAVIETLRVRLYDHLQRLCMPTVDEAESGDWVQRCTSDISTLRVFLSSQVVEIGRAITMLAVPIPLMLGVDLRMTAIATCITPFLLIFSTRFYHRVHADHLRIEEIESDLTQMLSDNLAGIRVVRAFARQDYEIDRFDHHNQAYRSADRRAYWTVAIYWGFSEFLCFAQTGLVVAFGSWWVSQGRLPIGSFFYFLTASTLFIFPMRAFGRVVSELGKATVAIGRLQELLQLDQEPAPLDPVEPDPWMGRIELEHVSFAYDTDAPLVLRDVSLVIEPRQTVAFIGASGAGKTTLMTLLLGFYRPTQGTIRIDGVDLQDIDPRRLRKHLAVVLQQPFLFSATAEANLLMAREDAATHDIQTAAEDAEIRTAIERLERGWQTKVGERGVSLSGGQRQRLALARALLRHPSILILDDALSAVDTRTETAILAALERRKHQQTTLIIAHRLSTVRLADRIVVLDRGHVVEDGTHTELLALKGRYAQLWSKQTGTS